MEAKRRARDERLLLMLTLACLAASALLFSRIHFRIDLSEGRANTLSKATRNLASAIDQDVSITYYRSKTLADRHPGPATIEDLLREMEAASRGRIRVRIVDASKEPELAESLGVAPQQMEIVERDERRVALVHTGLVVEYLDAHKTIPAVISTETLEYELLRAIRSLLAGRAPVAALLSGDADKTLADDFKTLQAVLTRSGYSVREQARGALVDSDVSVLFVLGNADLDETDARMLDAYLRRGGGAFIAARGVRVDPEAGLQAETMDDNALLGLLEAYGVRIRKELALDELSLSVPFQTSTPAGGIALRYIRYPHWVTVDGRNVDAKHPITERFAGLDLFWPSPMELEARTGLKATTLSKSGPRAWRQTKDFRATPNDEFAYDLEADATRGVQTLAVSLEGRVPVVFPDSAPAGTDAVPAAEGLGASDTRMVVVSSSDAFTDLMTLTDSTFNAGFAALAADWLSADEDLLSVKSRSTRDRRLDGIRDPEARRVWQTLVYIVSLGIVPAAALLALHLRNRKRRAGEHDTRAAQGGQA